MRYIVLAILLLTANQFLPVVTLAEATAPDPSAGAKAEAPEILGSIAAPDIALPQTFEMKFAAFQALPRMLGFAKPVTDGPDAPPAAIADSSVSPPAAARPDEMAAVAEVPQDPADAALDAATAPVAAEPADLPVAEVAMADVMAPEGDAADMIGALAPDPGETAMVDAGAVDGAGTAAAVLDTSDLRAVTASSLNVRQGPSSRTPVVATLKGGDLLQVTGERKGGWVQVETGDQERLGWVFSRYLEKLGDA